MSTTMFQHKLWLTTVLTGSLIALAAACSGSATPAAFEPPPSSSSGNTKDAGNTKDNPPPRPIDEEPEPEPDDAPLPKLNSIEPSKGVLNSVGPTILVNGALFVPRSKVLLDGVEVPTSYESQTQLKATIPDDKMKAVAKLKVEVSTAAPGGGTTTEDVSFSVENPKPELTSLDPLSVSTNSGTTTLKLIGKDFAPGATVRFGTSDLNSVVRSSTEINATIPSALLGTSASILVKVTNPLPGGGVSSDLAFTVSNPSATITALEPNKGTINGGQFALVVRGSGFTGQTQVLFNGTPVTTTLAASDQLNGTIPAGALNAVGNVPVTVQTPPPGGGVSAPFVFQVEYPRPTVTRSEPDRIAAGSNQTEVTIIGTLFFPTSKITFDGAEAATTFVDDKTLKATLTLGQLATAKLIDVKVVNPTPGGGASTATRTITVANGVPVINTFQPAGVEVVADGAPERSVDILGTAFVDGIKARARVAPANPAALSPAYQDIGITYVNSTTVKVNIPASMRSTEGKDIQVQLNNPSPGGGNSVSSSPMLQVLCNSGGVNVHLNLTRTDTLTPDYAAAPKLSRWSAGGTCPGTLVSAEQEPARYVVVQNSTTKDLLLTAWGVCEAGKGDGFLAFYKSATPPADEDGRKACTGSIAHGGALKAPDPDNGGAERCPGLLKGAGNGSLRLAACERAIVQLQSFSADDNDNPPPKFLKVKGEAP